MGQDVQTTAMKDVKALVKMGVLDVLLVLVAVKADVVKVVLIHVKAAVETIALELLEVIHIKEL